MIEDGESAEREKDWDMGTLSFLQLNSPGEGEGVLQSPQACDVPWRCHHRAWICSLGRLCSTGRQPRALSVAAGIRISPRLAPSLCHRVGTSAGKPPGAGGTQGGPPAFLFNSCVCVCVWSPRLSLQLMRSQEPICYMAAHVWGRGEGERA